MSLAANLDLVFWKVIDKSVDELSSLSASPTPTTLSGLVKTRFTFLESRSRS